LVPSWQHAVESLKSAIKDREVAVLVKGSNGMGLGNLVEQFVVKEYA